MHRIVNCLLYIYRNSGSYIVQITKEKIIYEHQDLSIAVEDFYQNEDLLQHLLNSGLREEKLTEWLTNGYDITVQLPENKYKAIVHKEAYDFTNLIGNSGGYIGLFLGK